MDVTEFLDAISGPKSTAEAINLREELDAIEGITSLKPDQDPGQLARSSFLAGYLYHQHKQVH